jgi:hypothetical protein
MVTKSEVTIFMRTNYEPCHMRQHREPNGGGLNIG